MKNSSITIQRGRSFKKLFSSNLLEHTTVFASFGMLKNDGSFLKRGQFETRVQEDGYFLSMNETETLKLKKEILQFDVLVERADPSWPEGKNAIFEYGGILKVE
ncbi:hypothetical protein [Leptospira santarosai]|uniref:hypothetical protein n=1 Tax=Leptospira santarosai TaxID=28183 RepID=UPI0024AF8E34|nr:hypothetical protein [Leptospira santarosai]MDI7225259.1 hypothetical protein [Leptospira santarosai]